jgi:myo-inositol-1(or 4)-monophosphatase
MIKLLQKAAKQAGQVLLDYFEKELSYQEKKSQHDIVTEADLASQEIIHKLLLEEMINRGFNKEEIGFIGEEGLNIESSKHLFIIDPVDGTTNFASGVGYFAVSIAYGLNGEIRAGVVYSPVDGLLYLAEKGKGAWRIKENQKIQLHAKQIPLKQSILNGHFNSPFEQKQFEIYAKMYPQVRGFRSMGCLTLDLCHFLDNVFGVVVNGGCSIWDIAAVDLMIKEAGGSLVDWTGKEIKLDLKDPKRVYQPIATHPNLFSEVLKFF